MRRYAAQEEEASGKGNRNALKMIGLRGREFARQFLTPSKQLCYLHLLLTEYAKLGNGDGRGGGEEGMEGDMTAEAAAGAVVKGRKEQQQPGGLLLRRKGP